MIYIFSISIRYYGKSEKKQPQGNEHDEEESMLNRPGIYRDGTLKGTSAWGNTYLGRDHHATARAAEQSENQNPS